MIRVIVAAALFCLSASSSAVVLVQTNDPGYYNNNIGSALNGTNGGDTSAGYFPISNDSNVNFTAPPDLSAANSILGNWLTDPLHLNSNWSSTPIAVPNSWAVGTEVAVIYQFDTLGATNVVAKFGVDNGIYVWLDGSYILGGRASGGPSLGEYQANLGNLNAGSHFLQLLLEDHGVTNGYAVNITADSYIPGPPPVAAVPEPESYAMLLAGLGLLGFMARRRKQQSA